MSKRDSRIRVVVTGIGAVSPNGIGVPAFADACASGKSGLVRFENVHGLRTSAVGQVSGFDPTAVMEIGELRRVPRMIPLALAASREALEMSRFNIDPENIEQQRTIGVSLGTGGGGMAFVEQQFETYFKEGKGSLFSITAGTHGNLSSELSISLHLRGPSHVLSTGCTSSTDAIGYAMMLIRSGQIEAMLTGGADAPISPGILTAFEKMRVVSTRRWDLPAQSSRPFSADRDGFVLAEGAWMFVLESLEHAQARGATILAELVGYGSTCDAYHRVQIAPDTVESVRAVEIALRDGDVAKDTIGFVNLHGTSTDMNDRMETEAMKNQCFGGRASTIPMSSTKSMIGHPQGACGAAGLAATILSMRDAVLHPTINLDQPDPVCDLDYVPNTSRPGRFDIAVCNCIAFGSKNSALIVQQYLG